MKKEIIICTLIITIVLIGNYITQKYTEESLQKLSQDLYEIKDKIKKGEKDKNALEKSIKETENEWKQRKFKLAYYIEHDELEKIETNMTSMKSFVKTKEYTNSINEIDTAIFIFNHIKDKYNFTLENIF